jgi:hypothetical protein
MTETLKTSEEFLYAELWRFRPAWVELPFDQKQKWMNELLNGIGQQLRSGVELVGFARNEEETPHTSGYDFLAVWKMPDRETAKRFEDLVESSGLHTYYEQINTRGKILSMDEVINALLIPSD